MNKLSDQPWWAKTLWVVGPTAAIALWLTYILSNNVASNIDIMKLDVTGIRENLIFHHNETEDLYQNMEEYMRVQNLLTRQLCVNASKNEDQKQACWKP